MVEVKTATMDLTNCVLEIPLLLSLDPQDILQGARHHIQKEGTQECQ